MREIKSLLLFCCISICTLNLSLCQEERKIYQEKTIQDSNSVLFKELHQMLSIGEHLSDKRYVFVLKFFNIDSSLYFSFWLQPYFPTIIPSPTKFVFVDTNNMFGFNIANHDIVIIDYPESNGHELYIKNQDNNNRAMLFKKAYEEYTANKSPIISNRELSYLTYKVENGKLIRVEPIIPPMYNTDKPFDITIFEKEDKEFLEFLPE
jgi:hypothetical protein